MNLNSERLPQTEDMLRRMGAIREDFRVKTQYGAVLQGWKIRPPIANRVCVLLFHGVSDNRTGIKLLRGMRQRT